MEKSSGTLEVEVVRLREQVALLQAQLSALLEASEGLAWVKDKEGRFIDANSVLASLAAGARLGAESGQVEKEVPHWPQAQEVERPQRAG